MARLGELAALACLAGVPFIAPSSYALGLLTLLAIYGILLIGLDVSVGYLGQINLGQAAFLGLGAYAAALCVTRWHFGFLAALAAAAVVGLAAGGALAFPALRLEGPQFALATLSFSALAQTTLNEWESLTNGAQGLSLTRPALLGHPMSARGFYWLCVLFLAGTWMTMRELLSSQWGRAFEALRDSPIATDAMGIGTYRHKVAAFALGSALGGFAGGLYAFNFQYLQPESFGWELMVILLLGVVLGGRKSLWGALLGSCIIVLLPNLLSNRRLFELFAGAGLAAALVVGGGALRRRRVRPFQALAPIAAMAVLTAGAFRVANAEDWRKGIFALMLFAVVAGLPDGLMGAVAPPLKRLFGLKEPPPPAPSSLEEALGRQEREKGPLLEIRALERRFGGVRAVDGVSMTVDPGEVRGLIGPNGSGKSTAVNVITGLFAPSGGEVRFRGRRLPEGSLVGVARAGIARTFQNLQLFGELTALENVMAALNDAYRCPLPLVLLGLARGEERRARAKAMALLELVCLGDQARRKAKDLTYGAQRFLEIARALARRPALLILDEPAAGLAQPDAERLLEVLGRLRVTGVAMILIEHHMDVVSEACERVTVLDGGKVIAEGPPEAVKRDARVIEAYLGRE